MTPLIVLALLNVVIIAGFVILSRPVEKTFAAPEVLIVAAHSDDCAIMGSEIAVDVFNNGGRATIVYFTCSASDPTTEIAKVRALEAKTAWEAFAPADVRFVAIDLPESPVHGPASYSDAAIDQAAGQIAGIMDNMAAGSVVVIPANCESHIDHVNARNAALLALGKIDNAKRAALEVYETTEYNAVVSMRYDPAGALLRIVWELPLTQRLLRRQPVAPGFLSGMSRTFHAGLHGGLAKKKEMLARFTSQDADLMAKFFSWRSVYRKCDLHCAPQAYTMRQESFDTSAKIFISLLFLDLLHFGVLLKTEFSPVIWATAMMLSLSALTFFAKKRRKIVSLLSGGFSLGLLAGFLLR